MGECKGESSELAGPASALPALTARLSRLKREDDECDGKLFLIARASGVLCARQAAFSIDGNETGKRLAGASHLAILELHPGRYRTRRVRRLCSA